MACGWTSLASRAASEDGALEHLLSERTVGGESDGGFDCGDQSILKQREATFEQQGDIEIANLPQEWKADAAGCQPECCGDDDAEHDGAEADGEFQFLQTEPGFIEEQGGPEDAGKGAGQQQQAVSGGIAANSQPHLFQELGDAGGVATGMETGWRTCACQFGATGLR
jgi:hypothetical protein